MSNSFFSRPNARRIFEDNVLPNLKNFGFDSLTTGKPAKGLAIGSDQDVFMDVVPLNAVELAINLIWVKEGNGSDWRLEAFDRIQDFVDAVDALGIKLRLRDWGDRRDIPGPGYMTPNELLQFLVSIGFTTDQSGDFVRVPRSEEISSA